MKRRLSISVLVAVAALVCCSTSRATITNAWWWDDGDGAVVCESTNWVGSDVNTLSMYGDQYRAPGHMTGTVDTATIEDPTLKLSTAIENDTSFAWTAYDVNVYMSTNFTVSYVNVTNPSTNWTVVSYDATALFTGSNWVSHIVFDTGTPVAINDELDYNYKLTFSGSTHYSFTQEMIPVPEPSAVALVAIGGLFLARFTLRRGRR
jgi:hypothetical protein